MLASDLPALVEAYTPLLVMFPEILPGSSRPEDRNRAFPETAPLKHDYHPRGVCLVLDNCALGGRSLRHPLGWPRRDGWRQVLDDAESHDYKRNLDLLKGVSRLDRNAFWEIYADIEKDGPEHRRRCYARVVDGAGIHSDRLMVQFWYPYFYNDFWNSHEMDWELVNILFTKDPEPRPILCAASAHQGGHYLPWPAVQKADADGTLDEGSTHPVIYVAHGSHANYFLGGCHYDITPPAAQLMAGIANPPVHIDFVMSFEEGDKQLVEAVIVPEPVNGRWEPGDTPHEDWRWLNQRGRWGSPGRRWDFKIGDYAPYGPPLQGARWDAPFQWINTRCELASDPKPPTLMPPPGE